MGLLTDEQLQEFLSVGEGFGSDENNGYGGHKLYFFMEKLPTKYNFLIIRTI